MPIFEYQCEACGTRFEKIQTEATANYACPNCGATAQKAVSLATGLVSGTGSTVSGGRCAPGPAG